MLSSSSYSLPAPRALAALSILLLVLLSLALLSGCTDSAANQQSQRPVSTTASQVQPPGPINSPGYVPNPNPIPSEAPTSAPVPTLPPPPTIDPSLPTATPVPTSTPIPTPTPLPLAPPLTHALPDPHQPGVQYFPQTGHTLRGAFLDYWNKHGGLPQFGYPITEEFVEAEDAGNTGLQVQYFQRNRFEYHPEYAGTPNEVQLGLLGTEAATKKGYFAGSYPRYGHAADFSWISGIMQVHDPPNCLAPWCGCSILRFEEEIPLSTNHILQLEGSSWRNYEQVYYPQEGTFFTAFGHLAKAGEQQHKCVLYANLQEYIVDAVQVNTTP